MPRSGAEPTRRSSRTVFPIPASPLNTSERLSPRRTDETNSSRSMHSCSRPHKRVPPGRPSPLDTRPLYGRPECAREPSSADRTRPQSERRRLRDYASMPTSLWSQRAARDRHAARSPQRRVGPHHRLDRTRGANRYRAMSELRVLEHAAGPSDAGKSAVRPAVAPRRDVGLARPLPGGRESRWTASKRLNVRLRWRPYRQRRSRRSSPTWEPRGNRRCRSRR